MHLAPVWIHDEAGRVVAPISRTRTKPDGAFVTPPLEPGIYSLFTRSGLLVARRLDVEVHAEASEVEPIELVLAPGGTVVVETRTGEVLRRARVRLFDENGRVLSGLRDLANLSRRRQWR